MRDCLIFLYYDGEIVENVDGVAFHSRNCLSFYVEKYINFESFRNEIVSRVSSETVRSVTNITYRFPISVINQKAEYRAYLVRDDNDLRLLFDCYTRYYPEISVAELMIDLKEEYEGDEAEPSERLMLGNEPRSGDYGDSNEEDDPDWRCSEEEEEGEDDCDYQDNDDSILPSADIPADMFYLDLEAMKEANYPGTSNPGYVPTSINDELQVGMQFQTKEDVQDTIKHYSVQKFVDYKVVKSNPTKYYVQCKMYGDGCD